MKTISILLIILAFFMACSEDSQNGDGEILLSASLRSSQAVFLKTANHPDSVVIERARFLLRNIRFKSVEEDSLDFYTDPYILNLANTGRYKVITVSDVPAGNYDRVEFRIHKLDDDDPRDFQAISDPAFADFVEDNFYSVIIEGVIYNNGAGQPFVFRSRDNGKQRHHFNPPIAVSEKQAVEISFLLLKDEWFIDESGDWLDPLDEDNEDEISENIFEAVEVRERDDHGDDDEYEYDD